MTLTLNVNRRASTLEIEELEQREYELWLEYRQLDYTAGQLANAGRASKQQIKRAQKRAVRAHRDHQRCADAILRTHSGRLLAEAR